MLGGLEKLTVARLANSALPSTEPYIPQLLHTTQALTPILSQLHPLHTLMHYFSKYRPTVTPSTPSSPQSSVSVRLPDNNCLTTSTAINMALGEKNLYTVY